MDDDNDVPGADSPGKRLGRLLVVLLGAAVPAAAGWLLYVEVAEGSLVRTLVILAVLGVGVAGARKARDFAESAFAPYNVAEVAVDGEITRGGGGPLPTSPGSTPAGRIVDQVEEADDDDDVEALVLRMNTPGGEIGPSEELRRAVEEFDGPTFAHAIDRCASGGYWVATGCDRIFAREHSVVGSIGVLGSRFNAYDAAEELGVSYERFAAGRFKDAGTELKELSDAEREYIQGIIDGHYDHFVRTVSEGRDLDGDAVRDTEARMFLAPEAEEVGLVDEIATASDVRDALGEELDGGVSVTRFQPSRSFREKVTAGVGGLAYAVGAGAASTVTGDEVSGFEFKVR